MEIQGVPDQNPMLNHVVLERIFKLVEFDTKTFANFRLVCKQWNETSLTTWRKNTWLSVTSNREYKGVHVEDFLQLLKSPEHRLADVPFRKYIISRWWGVLCNFEVDQPERVVFWNTVGPLMTHLSIRSTKFLFVRNLRNVVFVFTPNLQFLELSKNHYMSQKWRELQEMDTKYVCMVNKNLTHLKFNFGVEEYKYSQFSYVMDMLMRFPNIQILEMTHLDKTVATGVLIHIFTTIRHIREHRGPDYLQNLAELRLLKLDEKCRTEFTLELASLLTEHKFPLRVLTLDVGSETELDNSKEALKKVLECHAETLQELVLAREVESFSFPDFPFGIQFPKLAKLSTTGKLVQNLEFLNNMPNLEFLDLEQDAEEIHLEENFRSGSVVFEKMKQFKITSKFCSRKQISTLGQMMPNLTSITIGFKTSSGLRTAFNIWKELMYVNIYTGNSDEEEFWKSKDADKYIKDNIFNATNLKHLKIGEFVKYGE
ncbi:unnamed protein product [Orchesella dallaii]|uniref:F-box domain-containing protein n=1 Tax=Orchesella dallaii TaxID=48710 RepID=A0ABP1S8N3_9HEXA